MTWQDYNGEVKYKIEFKILYIHIYIYIYIVKIVKSQKLIIKIL